MSQNKRGLGKGLDALLKGVNEPAKESDIKHVTLQSIVPNPNQPRREFPEESLQELANSIKSQGVLQPILVRPSKDEDLGSYELIAGERRLRASKLAGLRTIPCIVKQLTDDESLTIAIIENLQREDLNAIDEALGLQQLQQRLDLSQEELAKQVGKSRPAVANALRLLQLPVEIQQDLRESNMSAGHARTLLPVDSHDVQTELRNRILDQGISVRQAESQVNYWKEHGELPPIDYTAPTAKPASKPAKKPPLDQEMIDFQDRISQALECKIALKGNRDKGQLVINYDSTSKFDSLMQILGL